MITVWSGSSPPPSEPIPVPDLAHLEVFTSRTQEEGRERYRVHLGYFDDPTAAARVLPRVRQFYPSAWVVPASRHRPLARLNGRPKPWAATAPAALECDAANTQAGAPAAEPTRLDLDFRDEISLDTGEVLALLEEFESQVSPGELELAPAAPPSTPVELAEVPVAVTAPAEVIASAEVAALVVVAAPPVAATASTMPASTHQLSAFSRYSIQEWCADEPVAPQAPAERSWLQRLPILTRFSKRRRAKT